MIEMKGQATAGGGGPGWWAAFGERGGGDLLYGYGGGYGGYGGHDGS